MTTLPSTGAPMKRTPLYEQHRQRGAKMTEFHGWEMPLYYSSILEEHLAVRTALGLFDIAHMGQVLVTGPDALATLNALLTSDLASVGEGRACYTLMLNESGGILDDLIVYRLGAEHFLVIVNCATHERDVAWMLAHRRGATTITDISEGRAMLAVQGPRACRVLEQLLDARVTGLGRFGIAPIRTMGPDACLARTGYTGSDGFELFVPAHHARRLWDAILAEGQASGAKPIGLGARDTLRVEAGLRLYGADMDEATTPWEAGLDWVVAINKPAFIGRDALVKQRAAGVTKRFIGFELAQGPVPRTGTEMVQPPGMPEAGRRIGTVTSGTYSPLLKRPLGMGYVEAACAAPGARLAITVRAQAYVGTIVKLPFWKNEAPAVSLAAPANASTREPRV